MTAAVNFGDYVVYVDESGDHSLSSINPQNHVFVLAFCIVAKVDYCRTIVPQFQELKFDFWGHDSVVLHSHDIRKAKGDFNILLNQKTRLAFIERLNATMSSVPMTIVASVIDKPRHRARYANPQNPYEVALAFCMERLQRWLEDRGQHQRLTHVVEECRGAAEDAKLELEFRRIADGSNAIGRMPNLAIRFMDKKNNSTGLQLADLVAHPIGRHVIDPSQPNRAFDLLEPKLRRGPNGRTAGYGLKIFP